MRCHTYHVPGVDGDGCEKLPTGGRCRPSVLEGGSLLNVLQSVPHVQVNSPVNGGTYEPEMW